MNIVEFLEARIAEQEAGIQGRHFAGGHDYETVASDDMAVPPSLTEALLAECAVKRRIVADWKLAAQEDGITDPADAEEPVALARRSMLIVLAAGYKDHPDYDNDWTLHS
ncbi:hypothetical protein SAMN04487914_111123 [Arthrobacter sp. ok909]|uniref:DUF6221 family protein n=1 Tax=Arthrobacter sp. ok909 TaxID=1761746 RepID=UPI000890D83E|nr:DUF6221 family protein [Arthrobacter sp. ok909]SDP44166.1 hypothetical protein SAMN04487914_111123 [Arthrobacter sp. ok909]